MKFFVDTANIDEIRELADTGLLDGVTTNPSLIAKTGLNFLDVVAEICAVVEGPVSAEVAAMDFETMLAEGRKLAGIADNIAVKVPLTRDGLKACKVLSQAGTMVNVTLCFSPAQALLAAKAGATFISPFVGRLDDIGLSAESLDLVIVAQALHDYYNPDPQRALEMLIKLKILLKPGGVVGITDHAQDALTGIVYVELPEVGASVSAGEVFGSVESVKSVSEIFAPLSGELSAVNEALDDAPELINDDPYGTGWIVRMRLEDNGVLGDLLDAAGYRALLGE